MRGYFFSHFVQNLTFLSSKNVFKESSEGRVKLSPVVQGPFLTKHEFLPLWAFCVSRACIW